MSLLPKSIHRCRRYPTKFNSGRDIPLEHGIKISMDGNGRWLDNIFVERAIPWAAPTTTTITSESKSSFPSRSTRSKGAKILAPPLSLTFRHSGKVSGDGARFQFEARRL